MYTGTFYGDSIFTRAKQEDTLDTTVSTEDNDKDFSRIFDEGANSWMWDSFNSHKKAYRDNMSKAHSHMRKKEWKDADKYLSEAKTEVDNCRKFIENVESEADEAAIGILINSSLSMAMAIIPGMNYIIGIDKESDIVKDVTTNMSIPDVGKEVVDKADIDKTSLALAKDAVNIVKRCYSLKAKMDTIVKLAKSATPGVLTVASLLASTIDDIYSTAKALNDDKDKNLTSDKCNTFKNNIISTLNKFSKVIDEEKKAVNEKIKEESRKR